LSAVEVPAWPEALPQHLSASQLALFARCREAFRQRYVLHRAERVSGGLVIGSAVHAAQEENFKQKIDNGVDLPLDVVLDVFRDGFAKSIDKNGGESDIAWGDSNLTASFEMGRALTTLYHEQVAPSIQPVAVEQKGEYYVPGVPVPLWTRIDVETETTVIDSKTCSKAETKPKGQWIIQALLYRTQREKDVDWHLLVKTTEPKVVTPQSPPPKGSRAGHPGFGDLRFPWSDGAKQLADRYLGRIIRDLHACYLMYGPDEPWPGARDHPWACASCGWRKDCPWWAA
jgi:hypothetical protein